jgi:hypothetical protein
MPYAHPTPEHSSPLFATLAAASAGAGCAVDVDRGFLEEALEALVPGRIASTARRCLTR